MKHGDPKLLLEERKPMEKVFIYRLAMHLFRSLESNQKQRLLKRLKYMGAVVLIFAMAVGGLAVWGTVTVVRSLAGSVKHETIQESIFMGKESLKGLGSRPITSKECLEKIGGVFSPTQLLTVPLALSFETVKGACWDGNKVQPDQRKQG